MSIPPIQTGQTGPIIRGAGDQESRRAALQPNHAEQTQAVKKPQKSADSFEPSTVRAIDAQAGAQLRRAAAQRQASVLAPVQPQTPLGTTGQIEPNLFTPPAPPAPSSDPTDATPDPVPPSATPSAPVDSSAPLPSDPVKAAPEAPQTPEPVEFTTQDLERLKAAFGATQGQDGFEAGLDLNSDGVINGIDLANLLSRLNPSATQKSADSETLTPQAIAEGILKMFGSSVKEGGASSAYDLNADGRIDGRDLAEALARARSGQVESGDEPATKSQATLKSLLSAFGKTNEQKGFAHELDLNGDGAINGADLAQYLARIRDEA